MREVVFENVALKQFLEWEKINNKVFTKIAELIAECRQEPFSGIGKPEPLKHNLKGCWSRRITKDGSQPVAG